MLNASIKRFYTMQTTMLFSDASTLHGSIELPTFGIRILFICGRHTIILIDELHRSSASDYAKHFAITSSGLERFIAFFLDQLVVDVHEALEVLDCLDLELERGVLVAYEERVRMKLECGNGPHVTHAFLDRLVEGESLV